VCVPGEQPLNRSRTGLRAFLGLGALSGVQAQKIMEAVATVTHVLNQVYSSQGVERPPRASYAHTGKRGRGGRAERWSGNQAEQAEHPCGVGVQPAIRPGERGPHRCIVVGGGKDGQPVVLLPELVGQASERA